MFNDELYAIYFVFLLDICNHEVASSRNCSDSNHNVETNAQWYNFPREAFQGKKHELLNISISHTVYPGLRVLYGNDMFACFF